MIDPEELKNVSLSEATMRPQDLIPVFIYAIRQIDSDNMMLISSMDELDEEIETNPNYYDTEDCQLDLQYLFDTLDAMAPEGYYFGSHPGDGSDYGFWECEDFELEE